jgi:hypothetical protein
MKRQVLPLALLLSAALGCDKAPPAIDTNEAPRTLYVRQDGAAVWRSPIKPHDEPVRHLRYGETLSAHCEAGTCRFVEGGIQLEVSQRFVTQLAIPSRVQYAVRTAPVYVDELRQRRSKRRLKPGERVEVLQLTADVGEGARLRIGEEEWVNLSDVKDHPETEDERRARLEAEKAQKERIAREAAAEKARKKATAKLEIENRKKFAGLLRNIYLDRGLDIKVSVSGTKADRLQLSYVLFNDVWSHRLSKEGEIDTWCQMGFKTIRMTNTWDWAVRFDCPGE